MVSVEKGSFKSIIVLNEDGEQIRIDEGNAVEFVTESGQAVTGTVMKIQGKGDKTKLQILPKMGEHEEIWSVVSMAEIWSVVSMAEGTLKLAGMDDGVDEEDDE
jgi:hypothetical protein